MSWLFGKKKDEKLLVDPNVFAEVQRLNLCYIETRDPLTPDHMLVYTKLKQYLDDVIEGKILWTIKVKGANGREAHRPIPKEYLPYLRALVTSREMLRCLHGGQWNIKTNDFVEQGHEIPEFFLKPAVWRIENKIDLINGPQFAPHLTLNLAYFTEAFDKMGRPIIYVKFPEVDLEDWSAMAHAVLYQMEKAVRVAETRGQHRIINIVDVAHSGLTRLPPKSLMKSVGEVFGSVFIERLAQTIVVNAAFSFRAIWAVGKIFMDSRTANKVSFLKPSASKKAESFAKWIAPDQLMTKFGGTHDFQYDFRRCEMADDKQFGMPESSLLGAYQEATGDKECTPPEQWPLPGGKPH